VPSRPRCSRGGRIIGTEPGSPSSGFMDGPAGPRTPPAGRPPRRPRPATSRPAANRRAAAGPALPGRRQPAQQMGGPGRVAEVDQYRRLPDQLLDAADAGADQRQPGQQRLLGHQRPGLPGRGEQRDISRGQQRAEPVAMAEQSDRQIVLRRSAAAARAARDPRRRSRTADHRDRVRGGDVQHQAQVLLRRQPGDGQHQGVVGTDAELRPRRGPVPGVRRRYRRRGDRGQPGRPRAEPLGLGHQIAARPEGEGRPASHQSLQQSRGRRRPAGAEDGVVPGDRQRGPGHAATGRARPPAL
jgi:hypothetical protein